MSNQSNPIVVPGGSARAVLIEKDDLVQVVDVEGKQVGDLVLFRRNDFTERFSQANTRKLENTIYLQSGNTLWSTRCRPLACIERDTVNRHDILSSACSPYDYPVRFGIENHGSCLASLTQALEPYGVEEHLIPDPMNVFMHQELSEEGTFTVEDPLSRSGDHIALRMLCDCLFAISACPQDQNRCNGGRITDLHLYVEHQERA